MRPETLRSAQMKAKAGRPKKRPTSVAWMIAATMIAPVGPSLSHRDRYSTSVRAANWGAIATLVVHHGSLQGCPMTFPAEGFEHQKVTKVLDWRAVMAG